ncbi:unnamed protein product, partial [Hapterophycus canaliculatus]
RKNRQQQAARELAEKKALAAQREEERRAKAAEEARRRAIETAFEKERAERLERARRKRRAEEKSARRKDGGGRGTEAAQKPSATARSTHHRGKKHAATNKSRAALAPIAVSNNGNNHSIDRDVGRKRQRRAVRLRRDGGGGGGGGGGGTGGTGGTSFGGGTTIGGSNSSCPSLPGVVRRSVKVAAGVRDGRRKAASHGATVPSLPVVPGWKAMAAGGTGRVEKRKRVRRRPPKGGVAAEGGLGWGRERDGGLAGVGGTACAGDGVDRLLEARNSEADLERLLVCTSGQGGDGASTDSLETNRASFQQQTAAERPAGIPQRWHQTEQAVTEMDAAESDREQSSQLAEGESLSMETLDSAFPIPGDGCDSGGGEGLGETSSPRRLGMLSPGWSSRSSRRSSEAGETSSGFLSDSAAIREGQAMLSGEAAVRAAGYARNVDGGACGGAAAVGSRIGDEGSGRLEIRSSGEAEAGPAVPGSLTAATDERAVSPGAIVQLPSSSAFPDSISDMSDNRTFIDQHHQHHEQDEEGDGQKQGGLNVPPPSPLFGRGGGGEDAPELGLGTGAESTDFLDGGRLLYMAD